MARALLPSPVMAGFPDPCWILVAPDGREACFHVEEWGLNAIAVFSSSRAAMRFAEWLPGEAGLLPRRLSLSEAALAARQKFPVAEALGWLDHLEDPRLARIYDL